MFWSGRRLVSLVAVYRTTKPHSFPPIIMKSALGPRLGPRLVRAVVAWLCCCVVVGAKEAEKPDVVLGLEFNLDIDDIHRFFRSFRATGGRAHLVLVSTSPERRPELEEMARYYAPAEIVFQDAKEELTTQQFNLGAWSYRYFLWEKYMNKHPGKFSRVLMSDVRDVVFQRDPFSAIEFGEDGLVLATEGRAPLGVEAFSKGLMTSPPYEDPAIFAPMQCKPVVCVGTVLGTSAAVLRLLGMMSLEILKPPRHYARDTSALVYLLWSGIVEREVRVTRPRFQHAHERHLRHHAGSAVIHPWPLKRHALWPRLRHAFFKPSLRRSAPCASSRSSAAASPRWAPTPLCA